MGGNQKGSGQPVAGPIVVPAKTPTVDEALDANSALLYSPLAPLAGAFSPAAPSAPPDPDQVRKDDRAVWAFVPSGFDLSKPEVLLHFHGHNYYVTARRNPTAGTVEARVPDWLPASDRTGLARATAKGASQGPAGHFYKYDSLSSSHKPLVLLPEDGHHTHDPKLDPHTHLKIADWDGFWCKESKVGTLGNSSVLGDLIENSLARLSVLPVVPPNSANYLTKLLKRTDLKRLYLTAHSGGGVPLNAALNSDLALNLPTTACFLDATYNDYRPHIRTFCETWDAKSHLGNGKDDSCLVIVFNSSSGTEAWKTEIVKDLTKRTKKQAGKQLFPVKELNHAGPADLPAVVSALKTNSILVIQTSTGHEDIPSTFTPLLLANP